MGLVMVRKTFSGAGRVKRREPNGRHQRATTDHERTEEREADVLATVINQPHRRGQDDPRSSMLGHALGRLLRMRVIDASQYRAILWAARAILRYMRHSLGVPMPRFPSILAREVVDNDGPASDEVSTVDIGEIEAIMADVDAALSTGADLDHLAARALIFRVCVMDREYLTEAEVGTLRTAANRLARAMELTQ